MGKFYVKPGTDFVQPSAASPIVNRTMAEEAKAVRHDESNSNLRIIVNTINNDSFSRLVTSSEDVPCLDVCALKSNLPTVTKENTSCFDIEFKLHSPCSSPGSRIVPPKRGSENGLHLKENKRNAVWQACSRNSINCDPLLEESIHQQTTFGSASSPTSSPCNEKGIDINIEPVDNDHEPIVGDIDHEVAVDIQNELTAHDVNLQPILVDIENEVTAPDSDNDLIGSSDDEFSPTQRFDRFSRTDGFASLPKKVHIDGKVSHSGGSDARPEASHRNGYTRATDELLLEASASYRLSRKRKIEFTDPNLTKRNQITALDSPELDETRETSALDQTEHLTSNNDSVDHGASETLVQQTSITWCRLPFNGHTEDDEHYRLCNIILAGVILRREHTSWLSDIPCHSGIIRVVDMVVGSSCKHLMLSSKCSEEHCTSKIDLNMNIPKASFNRVFNVFTKWFLQNAQQPNLRVILLLLSFAPKDHHTILMTVLSFAKMMVTLSNRVYRQALSIKLKEMMVNILGYKPWEAVRTLLVFIVTPKTELSEILDLLSVLELSQKSSKNHPVKDRLYESVSCLWHINESFVCPADLLFELLKECLEQMPVELKLTKDRMVTDLVKLPRKLLSRKFLIIDKFLDKYYPQNSEVAHLVKTSILRGSDVTKSLRESYETSRVKGTGPINPQWDYWDIRESQMKGFDLVMQKSQKDKAHEEINFRREPSNLSKEKCEVDVWRHDLFKIITSRNELCYNENLPPCDFSTEKPNDFESLVDLLISGKYSHVAKIISSCSDSKSLENHLKTLERELVLGHNSQTASMAMAILKHLPGSLKDNTSAKSSFIRMLNSLVVKLYKDSDYKPALKYLKLMRIAGVNHMDHVPEQTDQLTFAVICSDINFQARLFREAIRSLEYRDCLNFLGDPTANPEQCGLLEKLVKNMFGRFLSEGLASFAIDIFRIIFASQKSLNSPLDIGKYYEGVIFYSFVRDLKKNACFVGSGANLYTMVERVCGNSEPFHSITYRSLLVELHREKSPEDIILRVLRICLNKNVYPDFSRGPISPLVLDSHLAKEEISIYLKHYFSYFISRHDTRRLTTRPFVVGFLERPRPDRKIFSTPNDIMKTPRSVPDALERFRSVLDEISQTLEADFSRDCATISVQGVETLIRVFSR